MNVFHEEEANKYTMGPLMAVPLLFRKARHSTQSGLISRLEEIGGTASLLR